jgi:hypothetical protein
VQRCVTIVANIIANVIAQTQPIFLLPEASWPCVLREAGACTGLDALSTASFCGYNVANDVVAVAGLIIPTSIGPLSALQFYERFASACQTPCVP